MRNGIRTKDIEDLIGKGDMKNASGQWWYWPEATRTRITRITRITRRTRDTR